LFKEICNEFAACHQMFLHKKSEENINIIKGNPIIAKTEIKLAMLVFFVKFLQTANKFDVNKKKIMNIQGFFKRQCV